jgi:hypothetical protein
MPTIIQEDAPHPHSYRPDLPLRSELDGPHDQASYDKGYAAGMEDVDEEYRYDVSAELRRVKDELEKARDRIAQLEKPAA